MTEISSYEPGTPSWVDLGTPDLEASVSFYESLFGWSIPEGPTPSRPAATAGRLPDGKRWPG